MDLKVKVIRSKRKTISLQIKNDLSIELRVPLKYPQEEIEKFLLEKQGWINKHLNRMKDQLGEELIEPFSKEELKLLEKNTRKIATEKASYYSKLMGLKYNRIAIKKNKTNWGSCSIKKNLNFNILLSLIPDSVMNYVIVHELCHLKHMNHGTKFWEMVEYYCSDYKESRKWLKDNGSKLIIRLGK